MAEKHRWPLKHIKWWGGYNSNSTGTEVASTKKTHEVTSERRPEATTTSEAMTTTSANNNRVKWVQNLSKIPLTQAQEKALAHGPNFAVITREPPVSKYIAQIEIVSLQLKQGKVEERRGEIKLIL